MIDNANLAVIGATSLKGDAFLGMLAEAKLDLGQVFLLADDASAGDTVDFNGSELLVTDASDFDFSQVQHTILLGEKELSEQVFASIQTAGCTVVDASGFLGQRDDISLATLLEAGELASVVAVPTATTIQLWLALQPVLQETAVKHLHVNVMQCVAQGGKEALQELGQQTAQLLNFQEARQSFFAKQLAFNIIPQVGEVTDSGETEDEKVVARQCARLLVMPTTSVDVTMMWSPVFYGDVLTVSLQTEDLIDAQLIASQWAASPLLSYTGSEIQTPVTDASGKSVINLNRLRVQSEAGEASSITFCAITDPIHLSALAALLVFKQHLLG